jgi:hypothetical protein
MTKNIMENEGPQMTSQYDDTRWSWIGKVICTYAHAHAHAPEYPHACTHIWVSNTYCFSTSTIIRERASVLRDTYIVCLAFICPEIALLFLSLSQQAVAKFLWRNALKLKCHWRLLQYLNVDRTVVTTVHIGNGTAWLLKYVLHIVACYVRDRKQNIRALDQESTSFPKIPEPPPNFKR